MKKFFRKYGLNLLMIAVCVCLAVVAYGRNDTFFFAVMLTSFVGWWTIFVIRSTTDE